MAPRFRWWGVWVVVTALAVAPLSGCALGTGAKQQTAGTNMVTEATRSVTTTPPAPPKNPTLKKDIRTDGKGDVVDVMDSATDLTIFVRLLRASGLAVGLHKQKWVTVVAPTNEAFDSMDPQAIARLLQPQNLEKLRKLLRHHFIAWTVPTDMMLNVRKLRTFEGTPITVSASDTTVVMDGKVVVLHANVRARNGMVHTVNGVLLPKGFKP
jgi:uncharacterized surface protein with fasciclin (FAS1) repeats